MSVAQTERDHRVTLGRAIRSETIKLAGLRATAWLIGAALVVPFLITLIWASVAIRTRRRGRDPRHRNALLVRDAHHPDPDRDHDGDLRL